MLLVRALADWAEGVIDDSTKTPTTARLSGFLIGFSWAVLFVLILHAKGWL